MRSKSAKMEDNVNYKCKVCGNQLKRKDFRKYAVALILDGVFFSPVLMFITPAIIIPLLNFVVTIGAGTYFILKKHRYVYICKNCRTSYSEYALKLKEECGAGNQISS